MSSHLGMTRLIPIACLAFFSIGAARTTAPPLCGRSHAYAVSTLSKAAFAYDPDIDVGSEPLFISRADGDHLVAEGDYLPSIDPSYSDRINYFPKMQMGVDNSSGRWKTGLCWWHSRFHRASIYLMDFAPNQPKPSSQAAIALMTKIAFLNPATIPGYDSLWAFTHDFPDELGDVLSDWEVRTTLLTPQKSIGAELLKVFTSKTAKEKLFTKSAIAIVGDLKTAPRPIFLMEEDYGAVHAVLALGTRVDTSDGKNDVILRYVDSNYAGTSKEDNLLENGAYVPNIGDFGLIPGFDADFDRIQTNLQTRCGANYRIPR
jgi:hypothetical protein